MCFFGLLIRSGTLLFGNDDAGKQEPLCSLHVTPSAIISTSFGGDSRIWGRPTGSCILHAFSHSFLHSLHRLYSCVSLSVCLCLWVCECGCSHNAGCNAYSCPLGALLSNHDTLLPFSRESQHVYRRGLGHLICQESRRRRRRTTWYKSRQEQTSNLHASNGPRLL
jgi:hypothetical protein